MGAGEREPRWRRRGLTRSRRGRGGGRKQGPEAWRGGGSENPVFAVPEGDMADVAPDGHTASCRSRGICGPSACREAAASSLGKSDLFTLLIREELENLSAEAGFF